MSESNANIHTEFHRLLGTPAKEALLGQQGLVVWLYGMSGSGKSTLAVALERHYHEKGRLCQVLDGDNIRHGINRDLGFSLDDRRENIRRIAEIAKLFRNLGVLTFASFITPTNALRAQAREIIGSADLIEVYVKASYAACEKRDVKGLYAKAKQGEVKEFTGKDSAFEEPDRADLVVDTEALSIEAATQQIVEAIHSRSIPTQFDFFLKFDSFFMNYSIDHLAQLESEAIYVLRETAAQFENPGLLFSGGKDSIVMAWLARKAFWPAKLPFPLVHIDTGHNFAETMAYRDDFVERIEGKLIVGSVQASIDAGRVREETGAAASRNALQTVTLLDTIEEHRFDAALGGGRRDEEKARAKERFFSARDEFGQWDPKNQRPELWNIFNGRKHHGEHFRVFPLSNWTEMDIWMYIQSEAIALPNLYFAHRRPVFVRGSSLLAVTDFTRLQDGEKAEERLVRFRTIGDATCTGAVESDADTLEKIIQEVATARQTERGTRADDRRSETAMEDRKKEGYF